MSESTLSKNTKYKATSGTVCWESPANIALIKYWGKRREQIPINPSLSFVLRKSFVRITLQYAYDPYHRFSLADFRLNGTPNQTFAERIEGYLRSLFPLLPFLKNTIIRIDSQSTFPHSAGIASSAAAFSALALCLKSIEKALTGEAVASADFIQNASLLARLGSGSACRSVYNGMVLWGQTKQIRASSDQHAVKLDDAFVKPVFTTLRDAILIVDDEKKAVSSSAGHALMEKHPFKKERINQAEVNLEKMLAALAEGNAGLFTEVVENEALSLHGLMMSSNPGFILIKPNTIKIIDKIRKFRQDTGINICFTLDAGPNIHLIYFEKDTDAVSEFISLALKSLCQDGRWIDDGMGAGPQQIKKHQQ